MGGFYRFLEGYTAMATTHLENINASRKYLHPHHLSPEPGFLKNKVTAWAAPSWAVTFQRSLTSCRDLVMWLYSLE